MSGGTARRTVKLQPRDHALLLGLFESRLMTLAHATALYFDGRREAAKKRIQKLKAAGLLTERPRRQYEPSILLLSRTAFRILREHGALNDYPPLTWESLLKRAHVSPLTLNHELDVMSVKAAVTPAINALANHRVTQFSTWPRLFQFHARRVKSAAGREVLVRPDGFIRVTSQELDAQREHTFFLELDRSTEPQDTLAVRAACYLDYYRSGGLATRYGMPPEAYKRYPFRVLIVFRTTERRNNAAEHMLRNHPPILTQVWLTTMAELLCDPLDAIWLTPRDYLDIVAGTNYDPRSHYPDRFYRRQIERENLIANAIQPRRLFAVGDAVPSKQLSPSPDSHI